MPGWATDLIGVFLGAFAGTLFGYWLTVHHGKQERAARRSALFAALAEQLRMLPKYMPAFDEYTTWSLGPFYFTAAGHLLSGQVLDATKDARLIKQLVVLEALAFNHNEAIRLAYDAHSRVEVPKAVKQSRYEICGDLWRDLIKVRDAILIPLQTEPKPTLWELQKAHFHKQCERAKQLAREWWQRLKP